MEATTDIQKQESAVEFCQKIIKHFEKKADHNKQESLACFLLVVISTLSVPIFITLGQGLLLAKVIPSILSLLAAGATSWLQLRKPQQLWAMYRTAQRQLEDHHTKYRFKIGEYANAGDVDRVLAEQVAAIKLNTHSQWMALVPSPDSLNGLQTVQQVENKN
jgi:hypothetical protein